MKRLYLSRNLLVMVLLIVSFWVFADPVSYDRLDCFHHRPDGYQSARLIIGYLDYQALSCDRIEAGTKFVVACSVTKIACSENRSGFAAEAVSGMPSKLLVLLPGFTEIQVGDDIFIFGRFKEWYRQRDKNLPVFYADGWQFRTEFYLSVAD